MSAKRRTSKPAAASAPLPAPTPSVLVYYLDPNGNRREYIYSAREDYRDLRSAIIAGGINITARMHGATVVTNDGGVLCRLSVPPHRILGVVVFTPQHAS